MKDEMRAALLQLAEETLEACFFEKTVTALGREERMRLLLPSGDEKYLAFWVRDAAMMAESGLLAKEDLFRFLELIALCGQNGPEPRTLKNGLTVPPYAICDHINYDGGAVFFPGTYSAGEDQGRGDYGYFPPYCDNYYFILLAGQYIAGGGELAVLLRDFGGMTLLDRLTRAFEGYGVDPESGLLFGDSERYTVDWGFCDTVKKSGYLLMPSLLRCRAAEVMAELCGLLGLAEEADGYLGKASALRYAIRTTFCDPETGWLYSATGIGRRHDVWATAYAVYLEVTEEEATVEALMRGYREGTAVVDGYIRHTPRTGESLAAWEESRTPPGCYQNGAFWATPLGWYATVLYRYFGEVGILRDFLAHTARHKAEGAPFEWIDEKTQKVSGLRYGTSGVLPYLVSVHD